MHVIIGDLSAFYDNIKRLLNRFRTLNKLSSIFHCKSLFPLNYQINDIQIAIALCRIQTVRQNKATEQLFRKSRKLELLLFGLGKSFLYNFN